ncbi:hypothetical protein SPAR60_1085 [Streptococcus pneumoniae GA19923]|nr:hypothetical protein SPAR60_1085 [Streptococcus pneumoniae GA19923]
MKNKESKNYEIFFQAKDIKVMEYAFKQVIAKENKKKRKYPKTNKEIQRPIQKQR